jgi:hypothetical protein
MSDSQREQYTTQQTNTDIPVTREEQESHLLELNAWWWLYCLYKEELLASSFKLFFRRIQEGQGAEEDVTIFEDVLRLQKELPEIEETPSWNLPDSWYYTTAHRHLRIEQQWFMDQGVNLEANLARYYDGEHFRYILPTFPPA